MERDHITQVVLGQRSDAETQRRARDRIEWMIEQIPAGVVLDVGCSEGILARHLAERGNDVDGIDVHPDALAYARQFLDSELGPTAASRVSLHQRDMLVDDAPRSRYDALSLGEVIEHVQEPEQLVANSIRFLRPGGTIVITTPFGVAPAPDHHRTFYLSDLPEVVGPDVRCDHLSVADDYIRFVGTYAPGSDAAPLDPATLLAETEAATRRSQTFLHEHLDRRNSLLEDARRIAEQRRAELLEQAERYEQARSRAEELSTQLATARARAEDLVVARDLATGKVADLERRGAGAEARADELRRQLDGRCHRICTRLTRSRRRISDRLRRRRT